MRVVNQQINQSIYSGVLRKIRDQIAANTRVLNQVDERVFGVVWREMRVLRATRATLFRDRKNNPVTVNYIRETMNI